MKENSIEEDIEILESIIEEYENCSVPEIDMQVNVTFREKQNNALNNVLSDYKRALKELEEYEEKDKQFELLRSSISIQEVKENLVKYQEEYELLLEHQSGKESNRTKYLRGRIHMCQELLERNKTR